MEEVFVKNINFFCNLVPKHTKFWHFSCLFCCQKRLQFEKKVEKRLLEDKNKKSPITCRVGTLWGWVLIAKASNKSACIGA